MARGTNAGGLNRTAAPGRTPEAAAGMSAGAAAGKRRRTTASAPGRMARGTNAGGGLNRTAAPGIGGGPHAPTALRTTTVGITDRRGDT